VTTAVIGVTSLPANYVLFDSQTASFADLATGATLAALVVDNNKAMTVVNFILLYNSNIIIRNKFKLNKIKYNTNTTSF